MTASLKRQATPEPLCFSSPEELVFLCHVVSFQLDSVNLGSALVYASEEQRSRKTAGNTILDGLRCLRWFQRVQLDDTTAAAAAHFQAASQFGAKAPICFSAFRAKGIGGR